MRGALAAGAYGVAGRDFGFAATADAAALPLPTPAHLKWADMELGMFYHFDIPIFGGGRAPDPKRYNPAKLDTDQWMEAAKAYGAKYVVLTAKHGAGFMQWQSDIYPYGVKQATWRDGKGDLVRDFVTSAREYGMLPASTLRCTTTGSSACAGATGGFRRRATTATAKRRRGNTPQAARRC